MGDPDRAIARLPSASAVILRDYRVPDRAARAAQLAAVCRRRRLRLLVGVASDADVRLALAVGAGGVHLPERVVAHGGRRWRIWRRPGWLVTAAAHAPAALARARRAGADAVLLSAVFPTSSHPGGKTIGPLRFAAWTRAAGMPVYALGGMTPHAARRLLPSGAIGIAAIGGFAAPPDQSSSAP
ncbi:MAG: thiamine phosphate synthase [Rhodospirillales bacterium]|nr:thiamine phosphate synthase [Rhodospirillales bacterium]